MHSNSGEQKQTIAHTHHQQKKKVGVSCQGGRGKTSLLSKRFPSDTRRWFVQQFFECSALGIHIKSYTTITITQTRPSSFNTLSLFLPPSPSFSYPPSIIFPTSKLQSAIHFSTRLFKFSALRNQAFVWGIEQRDGDAYTCMYVCVWSGIWTFWVWW